MQEDQRVWVVKDLLSDYLKSPSLRHIRDPHFVIKLAHEIVKAIDRRNSIWQKWDGQREVLLKSALCSWVPVEDLRDFLNSMPGPALTATDVAQRLKAFQEESTYSFPRDELQEGCLALYRAERSAGTEMPAILGRLQEYVEQEEARLRREQRAAYEAAREQDRLAREERLLSGADCNWTQLQNSPNRYCRANGRTFRLSPTKDKMWNLVRVPSVSDDVEGPIIGKYRTPGDAKKVVVEVAYRPEPRW